MLIIVISLSIRRMPYTIRSSTAIIGQISPSVEEASISLGASQLKTFLRVTIPMMLPGVLSGAIMSWITLISELSSSVILYTSKTISNHELLYVLSSMIIGRDMRQVFYHYGIPLSSTALGSIAAHNLPQLSPEFYALVQGKGNQLENGKWLNLATSVPTYPF